MVIVLIAGVAMNFAHRELFLSTNRGWLGNLFVRNIVAIIALGNFALDKAVDI